MPIKQKYHESLTEGDTLTDAEFQQRQNTAPGVPAAELESIITHSKKHSFHQQKYYGNLTN